ncbi:MAG TPA: Crp/Fnr family transcriptional regulator [Bacteroidales bacterium]|jgi:CRP-like cAMP-binding protein|nr:Crp/Fnr family transcriptional regulator [Bacteroidales bacterium]OPZ57833.1 MAG: Transcriptional activatory protein AadR [Bacteroidetes bacterium ADurb.BinA012]MBK7732500.1 Crp/Fnr family transcriptional regulator [Bacteroidales bacterium]MBP7036546.1 Crp/Fnr family transcriptional regulator [Bacteroidales bacterium]MBP8709940.1 Crp/Fnr family transcriptional regulator [Bacteroidales bacterium]
MLYTSPYLEQCIEGPFSVFRDLPDKEKEFLLQNHSCISLKKGEMIFHEGNRAAGVYCLASGKVKVYKEGIGGREQIIRMVRPQGLIGFAAFISGNAYSASAVAIEESGVCHFDKEPFMKLIRRNPDLSMKLMRMMAIELSFSNGRTISLTQKHIRGRLAESLLVLRDTYGVENDGRTIKAYVSREDLACFSNMTTSNAIRTLSMFASESVIALDGKKISIVDPARLEKISQLG